MTGLVYRVSTGAYGVQRNTIIPRAFHNRSMADRGVGLLAYLVEVAADLG